ncbi:MAG TPA: ribose-phosphate pyrophosphokinase [Methanomicrobia archaeon]|nr:ribose-phosphate pyrophosphokinase [Methanomicrobia archaeon]
MRAIMGPSSDILEKLAKDLEIPYVPLEMRMFPDGEVCPRITNVEDYDRVYLFNRADYRTFDPNRYLIEFYLMAKTLEDMGIKRIEIIMPYMPYARQDKVFRLGEPFSLQYVLEFFAQSGVSRMYTLMAHITRLSEIMDITKGMRVVNISVVDAIVSYVRRLNLDNPYVVGPDTESEKWADAISHKLDAEYTVLDKTRDINTGEVRTKGPLPNLTGRQVVIVDDIVSTGKTIENAVKLTREKRPDSIHVVVVHGIFSGNAIDRLSKYDINIATSNTIYNPFSTICVEDLITRAIKKW